MRTNRTSSRRVFFMQVMASGLALTAASKTNAQAMVLETDPQPSSLGYKADASKVDKSNQPKYAVGQICGNCSLFQGAAGAAAGVCPLFAGKQVATKGWCSAWAKKA